jgi:hypothetical protein
LFVGISKLFLQDEIPVRESGSFICEDIEIISQDSGELLIIEVVIWHVVWMGEGCESSRVGD